MRHNKKYKQKPPVTRLAINTVQLSNGTSFTIVNDLPQEGNIGSFGAAFDNWMARTDEYTAESFIRYVKGKMPECIFLEEGHYKAMIAGKGVVDATKEEYEQENN